MMMLRTKMANLEAEEESLKSSFCVEKNSKIMSGFRRMSRPESLSITHCPENERQENGLYLTNCDCQKEDTQDVRGTSLSDSSCQIASQNQDVQNMGLDICLSQHLPEGTITRQGNMIQFVASDFMEKIKKSSSLSQSETSGAGGDKSHAHGGVSAASSMSAAPSSRTARSPSSLLRQSPDNIPYIDASAMTELETHACRVADSLDLMMGNIRNSLHKMSAVSAVCEEAYQRSVDVTCDSVDANIKSMYTLMARCDELNLAIGPMESLASQIKEIKRILDLFELQVADK